jgi:Magnesium chelatase, subunit ChlI C-terminal
VALLSVSEKSVDRWTEEARRVEKKKNKLRRGICGWTAIVSVTLSESSESITLRSPAGSLSQQRQLSRMRHHQHRCNTSIFGSFEKPITRRGWRVDVPAVPYKDLAGGRSAESSETIRYRVIAARNIQLRRFFDEHVYSNAQMGPRLIRKYCVLRPDCERIMEDAVTKLGFSARAYDRILNRIRTSGCAVGGCSLGVDTRARLGCRTSGYPGRMANLSSRWVCLNAWLTLFDAVAETGRSASLYGTSSRRHTTPPKAGILTHHVCFRRLGDQN